MLSIVSYNCPGVTHATVASTAPSAKSKKRAPAKKRERDEGSSEEDYEQVEEQEHMSAHERVATTVHVVIKAKTFDVVLRSNSSALDLRHCRVGATLHFEATGAAVERKTVEPLQFDCTPSKDGRTANVELRIFVLSSQMDNALFSVRISVTPVSGKGEPAFVSSEPFRIVSKKSQLEAAPGVKKRSRTTQVATREAVLEMIAKMDEQMATSHKLMRDLQVQNARQAAQVTALLQRLERANSARAEAPESAAASSSLDVETAFEVLLEVLQNDPSGGAQRLQELGRRLEPEQWQRLAPLFGEANAALNHHLMASPSLFAAEPPFALEESRSFLSGSIGSIFSSV